MAKKRTKKRRHNPIVTKTSKRTLTPESCTRPLAAKLLRDRRTAEELGVRKPYRYGKCATPSASYALRFGGGKAKATGLTRKKRRKGVTTRGRMPGRRYVTTTRERAGMFDWFM